MYIVQFSVKINQRSAQMKESGEEKTFRWKPFKTTRGRKFHFFREKFVEIEQQERFHGSDILFRSESMTHLDE